MSGPLGVVIGLLSAHVVYPWTERREGRAVRVKVAELRAHGGRSWPERRAVAAQRLADMIAFAGVKVPYYRDLFQSIGFDPTRLERDPAWLNELPFLTKDIMREQGDRMLSRPLHEGRNFPCKTGGSTGLSCVIYYDQEAADYSSAVTLYAREMVGKKHRMAETHFASRFPDVFPLRDRLREHVKCLAMNRSNIFFDRLDDDGIAAIWKALRRRRPVLVQAHPSTIDALACYVARVYGAQKAFDVFESSGELLTPQQRKRVAETLQCRVVDRYGLAEFGVVAYEVDEPGQGLRVFESEVWPDSVVVADDDVPELVMTGLRNRLMPLIRYRTGDLGRVSETSQGWVLGDMMGRVHDQVVIGGRPYLTHYIQDVLDRIGGIQEFQIDARSVPARLMIVPEQGAHAENIAFRINAWWPGGIQVTFCGHDDLVRVGARAKFRHIIT